jgi:hypothetical protein
VIRVFPEDGHAVIKTEMTTSSSCPPNASGTSSVREECTLDVGEDLEYQRREWRVQRAGWIAFAVIIAAALAGLLGDGPLSSTSLESSDGSLRLQYSRFARVGTTNALRLRFQPIVDSRGRYRIWLGGEYQHATRVREVSPEPEHTEDDKGRVVYVFRSFEPEASTEVIFYVQARSFGWRPCQVGLVGGDSLRFQQVVYP